MVSKSVVCATTQSVAFLNTQSTVALPVVGSQLIHLPNKVSMITVDANTDIARPARYT